MRRAAALDIPGAYHQVAAAGEDDDLLRLFGHGETHTTEAHRWLAQQIGSEKAGIAMEQMEEFDEVLAKLLATLPVKHRFAGLSAQQVLAAYPAEQVLAAYPPEQRVAGLSPEERLLTLPVEVLRGLSDAYVDSLPEGTRAAIRARLAQ